jgi:D-sedoheptulose 7-phosphate isomerase
MSNNANKSYIFESVFDEAAKVLEKFKSQGYENLVEAGNIMVSALKAGGKIISCGNGGSMSDAMHFAEELTGKFRHERNGIKAIAISDPSYITCTANDYGYENIFSRFIETMGNKGDVLLAISTSGNSPNIINAAVAAQKKEMKIIALTGKDGGQLKNLANVEIRVPHQGYSDRIQEIHIKVIHSLIQYIEENI